MSEQNEKQPGAGERQGIVRIRRNSHPVLMTVGLVAPRGSIAARGIWTRGGGGRRGSW